MDRAPTMDGHHNLEVVEAPIHRPNWALECGLFEPKILFGQRAGLPGYDDQAVHGVPHPSLTLVSTWVPG